MHQMQSYIGDFLKISLCFEVYNIMKNDSYRADSHEVNCEKQKMWVREMNMN